MPWVTAQQMLDRYDNRFLLQLVRDDNTPATTSEFLASVKVLNARQDSAGLILAYTRQGKRYLTEDLNALEGDGLALLQKMNADLALSFLASGRLPAEELGQLIPGFQLTMGLMKELTNGEAIFDIESAALAGLPATGGEGPGQVVCRARKYFGDVTDHRCCPPRPGHCC